MLFEFELDYGVLVQYVWYKVSVRYKSYMTDCIVTGRLVIRNSCLYVEHDSDFNDIGNFTLLPWDIYSLKVVDCMWSVNENLLSFGVYTNNFLPVSYEYCYVSNRSYQDAFKRKKMRILSQEMPYEHKYPYHCVRLRDEGKHRSWKKYNTKWRKYAVRILDGYNMTTCID